MIRFTLFVIIISYNSLWEVEDEVIQVSFYRRYAWALAKLELKKEKKRWNEG